MDGRKVSLAGLTVAVAIAISVPSFAVASEGKSGPPNSMDEAIAMGDPAASAPAFDAPEAYVDENGREISYQQVKAQALACVEGAKVNRCYTDALEAEQVASRHRTGSQSAWAPSKRYACYGSYTKLWVWREASFLGDSSSLGNNHLYAWYNLGSGLNNQTTSFATGDYNAHLSDYADGGGYWFPGTTTSDECRQSLVGTGWNNRISSRYRY
jgi:hypothetical protein